MLIFNLHLVVVGSIHSYDVNSVFF